MRSSLSHSLENTHTGFLPNKTPTPAKSLDLSPVEVVKLDSYDLKPFDARQLRKHFDVDDAAYVVFTAGHPLFKHVRRYAPEKCKVSRTLESFEAVTPETDDADCVEQLFKSTQVIKRCRLLLGTGLHEVEWENAVFRILVQSVGSPVATFSNAIRFESVVLFADNRDETGKQKLEAFCERLLAWDEEASGQKVKIYAWQPDHSYWQTRCKKLARPVDSVILPEEVKCELLADVDDFCSEDAYLWYKKHGLNYKRSYLFYGPPGTGKTSMISALAGHLQRNVCFLQLAHPKMTDDSLMSSIQSAPAKSIVVLEDVDALFGHNRAKTEAGAVCPLTFSGLLNALDGVGSRDGLIFVLTTNYVDRLDPALIRAGRVDVKVEFECPSVEQAVALFLNFYPDEHELARLFGTEARRRFGAPGGGDQLDLSMASLQQHFIKCRRSSAREAVERLGGFEGERPSASKIHLSKLYT